MIKKLRNIFIPMYNMHQEVLSHGSHNIFLILEHVRIYYD